MSRLSFQDAAEQVKSGLDIVDIIQRHVVLKKAGRNYLGKCPFHNDKSPSMNVSREKGMFKCFACGVGGDTLSFLMRIENKTYGEVIRDLAQDRGIDIIYEGQNAEAVAEKRDIRQKILDLNTEATGWFQARLGEPTAEAVMAYFSRRYPDPETRQQALIRFQIGYAPAGWENLTAHLKNRFDFVQANPDLLVTAGLANTRDHGQGHYDRFRHRLIIPIHDEKGNVVAFGGRALLNQDGEEDKPKYLNSPETTLYKKSQVLYGFHQAKESIRSQKAAVIMEGYFDVITAHLAGITEAVGSCGTAMTDQHLKLLARFGAETVYLAFDSDEAGLKAALSAIQLIEPYMDSTTLALKVLTVPNGKDPDDFIRSQGGEAFRTLMAQAQPFLDFKFEMALRGLDTRTSEGRLKAASQLTPLLAAIQRPTVRAEYLNRYAERIGISEEALLLEVKRHMQSQTGVLRPHFGGLPPSRNKKAISPYPSTSLQSKPPMLLGNVAELRRTLQSRQDVVEKTLLRLTLYSIESYEPMMRVLKDSNVSFSNPIHQEILEGLMSLGAQTDPSANGSLGTLIDKMNHLYLDRADVQQTFAELVLTAESVLLDLGDLAGSQFRENLVSFAEHQVQQLARCRRMQQLETIKTNALQREGDAIELTYQFQDRLTEGLRPAEPSPVSQETGLLN